MISLASDDPYDPYNRLPIKQLQETYPYIQWKDYINGLLPDGMVVDENEVVNLVAPDYFVQLGHLLATTPKRVVANYMMWRVHEFAVPYLSERFRERYQRYKSVFSGTTAEEARWKQCVDLTSKTLQNSVNSLYVQNYFNQDSKASAKELYENIRGNFEKILEDVVWMDNITRQEALRKVRAMTALVGYSDELLNNTKREEFYRDLEVDPDQFFESLLKLKLFDTDYFLNQLRLPISEGSLVDDLNITEITAYYFMEKNRLVLPANILQPPFFNANRPKYINYGIIGYLIGHEITHGFGTTDTLYDSEGNLRNWWQGNTRSAFLEKTQCIVDQLSNYTDSQTSLKLDGDFMMGESIADHGGIQASYNAYRQWAAANGPEPKLPGLDYTPEQMFWISSAQVQCAKARDQFVKKSIKTSSHPTPEFRVLGTFSNMRDFSKDFKCPEGSPMNPVNKCEVW